MSWPVRADGEACAMTFYDIDPRTRSLGEAVVAAATATLGGRGLTPEAFSITLLLHEQRLAAAANPPARPRGFGYRAATPYYPCSVVKLFYLVAAQARLAEGA